jgi:hypothetical protein
MDEGVIGCCKKRSRQIFEDDEVIEVECSPSYLLDVTDEIKCAIISFLNKSGKRALRLVCKYLQGILDEQFLVIARSHRCSADPNLTESDIDRVVHLVQSTRNISRFGLEETAGLHFPISESHYFR